MFEEVPTARKPSAGERIVQRATLSPPMLASALILGAVAWVAFHLTRVRPISPNVELRGSAALALLLATLVQSVHFAEEAATGFHERFPVLLGLSPMPFSVFLLFNVSWIAVWLGSVTGVRSGRRAAFFAAWFLALAGCLNGLAHPGMALAAGGYFPGLVSSPLIGGAALLLCIRLLAASRPAAGVGPGT